MRYGMTAAAAYGLALRLPQGPYDPEWREARVYEPANADGHRAVVLVARWPSQFWRVICPDLGLDLATGSGLGDLATAMAEAIANGCLGPHTANVNEDTTAAAPVDGEGSDAD